MSKGRLVFVDVITREMVRAEPEARFVFGDNVLRRGRGGQAREMRGEPNAIGVVTKFSPSMRESGFFCDADIGAEEAVRQDLWLVQQALIGGRTVYFPRAGIGTGLAQLPKRAPVMHERIKRYIDALKRAYPP